MSTYARERLAMILPTTADDTVNWLARLRSTERRFKRLNVWRP